MLQQDNNTMPMECSAVISSDMEHINARNMLELTNNKQKQLRRQRTQRLLPQLLLKRTHVHVCQLLNSDCSIEKPLPLANVDTNSNKRKFSIDDHQVPVDVKKSKSLMDPDILKFLEELNAVKIPASDQLSCQYSPQPMEIVLVILIYAMPVRDFLLPFNHIGRVCLSG